MINKNKKITYKSSGVDVDKGNRFINEISPIVKETRRDGADSKLGGFGSIFDLSKLDYKDPLLVSATDGVGTKLKLAFDSNIHDTVGIDLVAMCVNDILAQGGEPLFFLDYFATSKLDITQAADVLRGIAKGCKIAGCALVGGETAELPGFYKINHYDLAGFCVGAVERDRLLPLPVKEGDVIVGLPSSGIHSNGYSLVHKIISNNNIDLKKESLGDNKLIRLLLEPTRIYTKEVQTITKRTNTLKAVAHVTGGGLTENLPRVISDKFSSEILLSDYPATPIYSWIKHNSQLEDKELMRTFNCGIGLVMVFDSGKFEDTRSILESENIPFALIGEVIKKEVEPVIYLGKLNL